MSKHVLSVIAFIVATFATQAPSHFLINVGHYAEVTYMRKEPIFPLGILSMVIEGAILSYLYSRMPRSGSWIMDGLKFGWLAGGFLVSYIAFGEAGKYQVPSVGSWIGLEVVNAFAQFTLFGIVLGFIHSRYRTIAKPLTP